MALRPLSMRGVFRFRGGDAIPQQQIFEPTFCGVAGDTALVNIQAALAGFTAELVVVVIAPARVAVCVLPGM